MYTRGSREGGTIATTVRQTERSGVKHKILHWCPVEIEKPRHLKEAIILLSVSKNTHHRAP